MNNLTIEAQNLVTKIEDDINTAKLNDIKSVKLSVGTSLTEDERMAITDKYESDPLITSITFTEGE